MPFKVFYAWQSDRDEKVCRYFIRDAAEAAVTRVAKECDVEDAPAFDHATEGESGLVHIAETIKRKIAACGALIADMTHAAEYETGDGRRKRATNANVAIEFGYAMHVLDPRQIILVMNDHFGPPEDLPFDLRHYSFPIRYTLASREDPEFKAKRETLIKRIAEALRLLMASGVMDRDDGGQTAAVRQVAFDRWEEFDTRAWEGNFRGIAVPRTFTVIGRGTPAIVSETFLSLSIIPLTPLSEPLDMGRVNRQGYSEFRPIAVRGHDELYARCLVTLDDRPAKDGRPAEPPTAVTELTDDGCLFAVASVGVGTRKDGADVVAFEIYEAQVLEHLPPYVRLLRALRVRGPLEVRVTLKGAGDVYIQPTDTSAWDTRGSRKLVGDKIDLPPATVTDEMEVDAIVAAMRPTFLYLWREGGYEFDPCYPVSA